MIENPMDVLKLFPIRKNKKQKQAFRDSVQSYVESLGYPVSIETRRFGPSNVVIGNPDTAKYLVTAHYDTPAALPLPNLITPCNALTFLLYQFVIVGMFVLAAIIPGILAGILMNDPEFGSVIGMAVYWVLLAMMMVGPANKSNANDNTSGVVTVLETARSLPEEFRDQVCFVLFDLEEAGLVGSSAYAKKHKKEIKNQFVLNCDCVGDGDELMMFPNKKVKKNTQQITALRELCGSEGSKSLALREKGFAYYPSDQKHFPYGVAFAAFRRSKWAGLYCDKIHTKKDTVLDENNVSFLRDKLIKLIVTAAK